MHLRVAEYLFVEYHYYLVSPALADRVGYSLREQDFEVLFA